MKEISFIRGVFACLSPCKEKYLVGENYHAKGNKTCIGRAINYMTAPLPFFDGAAKRKPRKSLKTKKHTISFPFQNFYDLKKIVTPGIETEEANCPGKRKPACFK